MHVYTTQRLEEAAAKAVILAKPDFKGDNSVDIEIMCRLECTRLLCCLA